MSATQTQSSIRAALDIVADRWTLMMLRELFSGTETWRDLTQALTISPTTLKRRLDQLTKAEIINREQLSGRKQVKYRLTDRGIDLFPFLMAAREWQLDWDARPEANVSQWLHSCGKPMRCKAYCEHCREPLLTADIKLVDQNLVITGTKTDSRRYRQPASESSNLIADRNPERPKIIDILGESRTTLIMAALLRGINRFDDIQRFTNLPPATVSNRLRRIQLLDLGHTRLYQENPDRVLYEPNAAGKDLLIVSLQLMQWSNKWLQSSLQKPTTARHHLCGHTLGSVMHCKHCLEEVTFASTKRV